MAFFNITEDKDYLIFNPAGDFIGGEETESLKEALRDRAKKQPNKIIINLTDVSYIDSAALGMLLSVNAYIDREGGKMAIYGANDYTKNLFSVTRLNLVLKIVESLDDAVKNILG
ncbi:MAG: STAS domain-containing protein [Candidatus Kapabacteria bacterium]|jgi:anti-sigma B factor antagonist|nr:STAS domain-containing protein [Candidatus Kapabacteria bacterium]